MRILITGAAGFLGSHLSDRFLAEGHEVVGMDNLITGARENVAHLKDESRFGFVLHDVSRYIQVDGPVDGVLHFASPASPIDYLELPIQTLKVGSLGTHNALGLAKAKGARFFLASTSEVYGDPQVHPQPESYWGHVNPVGPRGVYDEAKRFAEAITMAYHRYHGIDTRIVRIFNTYGPRMRARDGRVVSNFIVQALKGEPLTIYGEGQQTRSFCYVSDLVDGIYRLFMSDHADPVNIGNPNEFTVRELAELVLKITGSRSKIEQHPLPTDDPKVRKPDITKARTLLGWEGMLLDLRTRAGDLEHQFGQLPDSELVGISDIHRIGMIAHEEPVDAVDQIRDIAERTGLLSLAVDGERLTLQRLDDEVRHHPAVAGAHAWTVGIEDPDDAGIDPMVAVIRHRDRLGEALGLVVDAARPDRVDVTPVALRLRMHLRIAIDLGRRRKKKPRPFRLGQAERVVRAK